MKDYLSLKDKIILHQMQTQSASCALKAHALCARIPHPMTRECTASAPWHRTSTTMTPDTLEPEDRAWAENWIRLRLGLDRVRKHRPRAFAWLVGNVPKAAELAARPGWADTPRIKHAPTDGNVAAGAQTWQARQPAEPLRDRTQQLDALTSIPLRAAHLSPAQLDALNPLPNGRKRS